MNPLWTPDAAAAATGGRLEGHWPEAGITGVSIDTREMAPGDLFVALQDRRDGHDFVADALVMGAAGALVTRRPAMLSEEAPLLVVDDTLAGLRGLAAAARARSGARVIAITGSVGKTSTKEMVASMAATQARTHAALRSFNNHWGVPLTLARMPAETEVAVVEIGMNHAGEITPLTKLARPHLAMVTAVRAVHLENFESIEGIADAKAEIFAGLEPGGTALVPADCPYRARLERAAAAVGAEIRSFGSTGAVVPEHIALHAETTVVRARVEDRQILFRIGAAGRHFAQNACAGLAAIAAIGLDPARAALALPGFRAPEGRGAREVVRLGPAGLDGEITLIDESFNANPASMRAAFEVLAAAEVDDDVGRIARGRRIAFLGDMLELGGEELALHAALAEMPEIAGIDLVHCCGPRMKALHAALPKAQRGIWAADSVALAERARRLVDAGDVCMVKGSKGARMGPVLAAIRGLGVPGAGESGGGEG